jgi:hypothetical protein
MYAPNKSFYVEVGNPQLSSPITINDGREPELYEAQLSLVSATAGIYTNGYLTTSLYPPGNSASPYIYTAMGYTQQGGGTPSFQIVMGNASVFLISGSSSNPIVTDRAFQPSNSNTGAYMVYGTSGINYQTGSNMLNFTSSNISMFSNVFTTSNFLQVGASSNYLTLCNSSVSIASGGFVNTITPVGTSLVITGNSNVSLVPGLLTSNATISNAILSNATISNGTISNSAGTFTNATVTSNLNVGTINSVPYPFPNLVTTVDLTASIVMVNTAGTVSWTQPLGAILGLVANSSYFFNVNYSVTFTGGTFPTTTVANRVTATMDTAVSPYSQNYGITSTSGSSFQPKDINNISFIGLTGSGPAVTVQILQQFWIANPSAIAVTYWTVQYYRIF